METDFAKVSGDASGLAADMVRVRSERAEAPGGPGGPGVVRYIYGISMESLWNICGLWEYLWK